MHLESSWTPAPPKEGIPPFSIFAREIQKSPNDDRSYRMIELANGLRATLVHDGSADKAAASLDVAVGHLSDPDDMPGLAHFTEHLLFLGTEHFLRENEYKEFLAKNNGRSNAYTSTSNTNYYFSVGSTALHGALSRFAAFFHCPLFTPSCTTRELNAVNSENKKNLQADSRRVFQLTKHLSKPGHAWRKFGTGNTETLLKAAREKVGQDIPEDSEDGGPVGQEARRRLIEWWTREYSASRMRLCVIGQESLEELSDLVSKLFSPISGEGNAPIPTIHEPPMGPSELGTLVRVQTIKKYQSIEITFPLEYQPKQWEYKPGSFLSHFLGHEGPGSLYSYLKGIGLVTSLSSSGASSLGREMSNFKITITLTEDGLRRYQEVLLATFQYISLLKTSSPFDGFHQREIRILDEISFQFAEKGLEASYAQWIATHSQWEWIPMDQLLTAPRLVKDWDSPDCAGAKKADEYLNLLGPRNCRVFLMARKDFHQSLPGVPKEEEWEKEPWYGTQFHVERLDEEFLKKAEGVNEISDLRLPAPNDFVPSALDIHKIPVEEPSKRPFLIRQTPMSVVWHKKDDQFWVPRASVFVCIRSPHATTSPKASVMKHLWVSLVNDALSEYTYDASLAGLHYGFGGTSTGTYISVFGYNDKLPVLLDRILDCVKAITFKPERLPVMKEKAKRGWENFHLSTPYSISDYYTSWFMTSPDWTPDEKLAVLDDVTLEDIQLFARTLLSAVQLRILVNGNIEAPDAVRIAEQAETHLGLTEVPASKIDLTTMLLKSGTNAVYPMTNRNPDEVNSALSYYVHFGPIADQRLRVVGSLVAQILSEPAFSTLRTKEQLGYVVFCSAWTLNGSTEKGMRICVQSEKHPVYLEQRVDAFLEGMQAYIESLDEETFKEQKAGLQKKWTQKDKKLSEESDRFIGQVQKGQWDFLRGWNDANLLDEITMNEVLELFSRAVHPASPTRSKLSVHLTSQRCKETWTIPDAITVIENAEAFKAALQPASTPGPCIEWGDLSPSRTKM
ncbi:Metalloenzyme, LuxS/M16 peptidase-like protein [Flagelloscypha sp. PMI_526]|nr:Metalloenzyme, LuxS/M16 peptidase-like protein [Flagelloscypha sp. PMI_526]